MPFPTIQDLVSKSYQQFVLSDETYQLANRYFEALKIGSIQPGDHLKKQLENQQLSQLSLENFIRTLLNTKKPKAFAEQVLQNAESRKDSGYNDSELEILAQIASVIPSYIYNDGGHNLFYTNHDNPLPCVMGFISAPLFTSENGSLDDVSLTAEVSANPLRKIDTNKYQAEVERRLLPTLLAMNEQAKSAEKKLAITIPGLGCGFFGGPFGDDGDNSVYRELNLALKNIILKHSSRLDHIASIYFDTYNAVLAPEMERIGDIYYSCVASSRRNGEHKQLELSEQDKLNPNILLGTIVAADLLSWIGNDMWVDSRSTDEGVKAGSSLVLVQIACALAPEKYSLENFEYTRGAYRPKNSSWRMIGNDLKTHCKYANSHTSILKIDLADSQTAAHQFPANPVTPSADGQKKEGSHHLPRAQAFEREMENEAEASDRPQSQGSSYFYLKCLGAFALISASALAIGIAAVAGVLTANLAICCLVAEAIVGAAVMFGLFSQKGNKTIHQIPPTEVPAASIG